MYTCTLNLYLYLVILRATQTASIIMIIPIPVRQALYNTFALKDSSVKAWAIIHQVLVISHITVC